MVLVEKCPFFNLFLLRNRGQENVFYDILERSSKRRKIDIFCKAVNPWFWSKNVHFANFFFFGKIGQQNVFYDIIKRKNVFLGKNIKKFKKSKNWQFSKEVNPWFWSKNGHYSNFFFFRQYRPGKCLL